jgi:hypothetical protein
MLFTRWVGMTPLITQAAHESERFGGAWRDDRDGVMVSNSASRDLQAVRKMT